MRVPLAELCDRYTIVKLKLEHDLSDALPEFIAVCAAMMEEAACLGVSYRVLTRYLNRLREVNAAIWRLESDLRRGREHLLGVEEVGRRAIRIRDFNRERVAVKNAIIVRTGQGFADFKVDHASAEDPR
jgi:hypothetical protein